MSGKTRVTLADDHPIVLAGLRNLIEAEDDFDLVGHATSGTSAFMMIRDKLPDVAIVDIAMPGFSGIAVARRLAAECPSVRVVILTFYEEQSFVKQALAAGVSGYVLKRSAAENLVEAIRAVARGTIYIDPLLADSLPASVVSGTGNASHSSELLGLTDRETSVLKYLARGLTSKEIAARLELSIKTVDTYKARATEKLQLKTRADIVRFGLAQGWLEEV